MDAQMEDLDPDGDAPEISRQKRDVEEGCGAHTEHDGRKGIEKGENQGVACEVAADFAVPDCAAERGTVENPSLGAVYEHGPEGELAYDLVEGSFRDKEFFKDVGEAVKGSAEEGEQVAFDLISGGEGVVAREVVGAEEDAHAANADEDSGDLSVVVAHAEEEERYNYDDDYGPEVDELGA